jgi:hypothetical protein
VNLGYSAAYHLALLETILKDVVIRFNDPHLMLSIPLI